MFTHSRRDRRMEEMGGCTFEEDVGTLRRGLRGLANREEVGRRREGKGRMELREGVELGRDRVVEKSRPSCRKLIGRESKRGPVEEQGKGQLQAKILLKQAHPERAGELRPAFPVLRREGLVLSSLARDRIDGRIFLLLKRASGGGESREKKGTGRGEAVKARERPWSWLRNPAIFFVGFGSESAKS